MTDEMYGDDIRRRRIDSGLSQDSLAKVARLSRNTVSNVERGIRITEDRTKQAIERALEKVESGAQLEDLVVEEHRLPSSTGPCLIYIATDGTRHAIDAEAWDPDALSDRERAIFGALVTFTLPRLGGAS